MSGSFPSAIAKYIDGLIDDAVSLLARRVTVIVDQEGYSKLKAGCEHLASVLGPSFGHWTRPLTANDTTNTVEPVEKLLGTLRAKECR